MESIDNNYKILIGTIQILALPYGQQKILFPDFVDISI
jgi:hypothetical protein